MFVFNPGSKKNFNLIMYPGIDGEEYNRNISVAKGECKKKGKPN